jgi:ketosteroid isomerase-like protein
MSDGKQPHGLFTLIIKNTPDGWRIVHDHTSAT